MSGFSQTECEVVARALDHYHEHLSDDEQPSHWTKAERQEELEITARLAALFERQAQHWARDPRVERPHG